MDEEDVNILFPTAKFSISMDYNKFYELLTDEKEIIIQRSFFCYCYDNVPISTMYYTIKGKNLTYKYIIDELIKQNLVLDCDHLYLKGFHNIKGNLYEIIM